MAKFSRQPFSCSSGLCLHPPGCCPYRAKCSTPATTDELQLIFTTSTPPPEPTPSTHQQQQLRRHRPMMILYSGRLCTVDVTEAQARFILHVAQLEAERLHQAIAINSCPRSSSIGAVPGGEAEDTSAFPGGAIVGMSMKGSLRQFLEKRADRFRNASSARYS